MLNKSMYRPSRTTGGIFSGLSTLLFIGILILIQLIAREHNARFDLTKNKRFSLSPQTKSILQHLDKPVHAYCFYTEKQDAYDKVKELLEQYAAASPKFTYRYVDLDKDPLLAQQYGVIAYETIVLTYEDRDRKVGEPTEKAITNALLKLTRGQKKKKIYFLSLHGELDMESQEPQDIGGLVLGLKDANYETEPLNLLKERHIPEDCSVLVLAGPKQDPSEDELDAIQQYLEQGGHLIAFLDPFTVPRTALFFKDFGIDVGNDVVLDPRGYQNLLQPIIENYPPHEITKDFTYGTIYHLVRSVSPAEPLPQGTFVQSLAQTSPDAWIQSNPESVNDLSSEFNDARCKKGPVSIAVACEITLDENPTEQTGMIKPDKENKEKKTGKIVVFGDSDFMSNAFLVTFPANVALVSNAIHWLTEEKDLIAIPPKDDISQPLNLTPTQQWTAFLVPVIFIPLLISVFGIHHILHRRKRG